MAARQKALDARAAELDRKTEALARTRAALEDLKRELDASMTGDKNRIDDDHTSSSVSIPYSAKLLRPNNALSRTVRIQKRVLICLAALAAVLIVLLFVRESELRRARTAPEPEQSRTPAASAAIIGGADGPTAVFVTSELLKKESGRSAEDVSASAPTTEQLPVPESEKSGGGL